MSIPHTGKLAQAKILIAGCGDLGIRLAHQLGDFHATQVLGLRRTQLTTAAMPKIFRWLSADLTDTETLEKLPKDITHIVFAAAPGARTPADYKSIYLHGLQQTIEACLSPALERVIFISSSAVYGNHEDRWDHYLWIHAPELCDMEFAQLEHILQLESVGVEIVRDERPIMAGIAPGSAGLGVDARALDGGDVHEHVGRAVFRLNEAETFGGVEPLDITDSHGDSPFLALSPHDACRDIKLT
jgi:hypothetical protein